MAHFAKIDENNIVTQVIVVANDIPAGSGTLGDNDKHVDGEIYCTNLLGGTWKQTSYNNKFRKQYAGIGYTYDSAKDKFLTRQPFASWSLDSNDDWQAPISYPSITDEGDISIMKYNIEWNEEKYIADNTKGWEATKSNDKADPKTIYDWNGTAWIPS